MLKWYDIYIILSGSSFSLQFTLLYELFDRNLNEKLARRFFFFFFIDCLIIILDI